MTHYLQFLFKAFQRLPMKAAMLLVAALMLMPQEAASKCTSQYNNSWLSVYLPGYGNDKGAEIRYDQPTCSLTFRICVVDQRGNDAAFFADYGGNGAKVYISKDGVNYIQVFRVMAGRSCNYAIKGGKTGDQSYRDGYSFSDGMTFTCDAGTGNAWSHYTEERQWVWATLSLDKQWRNCNIYVKSEGYWIERGGCDTIDVRKTWKSQKDTVQTPFSFSIRQIKWNGDYIVSPDGTVTIPYKFEGTGNTDGETHIRTLIGGKPNNIGKNLNGNYSNGSYSFKLSDIGKDMTSTFTIQPYHEFTHYNDKDVSNAQKDYVVFAGQKTFMRLPVAMIRNVTFQQAEKQVVLTWTASNTNYSNGKWVIYRNNTKIGEVNQDVYTYTDKSFANESDETYKIYYVMKNWNTTDCVNELCSNEFTVNTTRHIPLLDFNADNQDDRIALTWQSDSLPEGWGHLFYVYLDKETTPVDTIFPAGGQTSFRWEHRTTDQHTDQQNKVDAETGTPYIEEPLTATNPHTYKVVGVAGNVALDSVITDKIGIGTGTIFYSIEASKNTYAGRVELSWHVNRQGSEVEQTYTVYRRRAEKTTDVWTRLGEVPSTKDRVSYTDNTPLPGVCYEYRVHIEEKRPDGTPFTRDTTDIGFAQASGTISGRITFGTSGMAVQGVEVEAKQIGEEDAAEQYHAIHFTGENGQLIWNYPSEDYAAGIFSTKPWSIQMWISPDSLKACRIADFIGISAEGAIQVKATDTTYTFPEVKLNANEYRHLTLTRSGNTLTAHVMFINEDSIAVHNSQTVTLSGSFAFNSSQLTIGGFKGYVDEFRLWTKCLTEKEIKDNYDHLLVGSEKNLETYWTFDEGLNTQFFDYSRDGTDYRSHHGTTGNNTWSEDKYVPDRLALRARTDSVGNYIIRGVPFSGEGTTYAVIPMLGVHAFNPTQHLRYVSANSLVHNGTDFDDVSSFPVSGTVLYAGTNYPVEGCNLYVDGQVCSKDGELIETNAYGQFTISVPIGEHFIQVKKQGHEFVNNGRYPDKSGTYVNFDREVKNLTFYDSTLVNFTGRVAGGDIEGNKTVGFGQSINNIGMATLTLTPRGIANTNYYINAILPTEGTVIQYEPNPNIDSVASASPDTIHSKAWRGGGTADECQKFYIRTDSLTGEFSAMLPPLDYIIENIKVNKTPELEILKYQIAVDMTNPQMTYKDSVQGADGTMHYYEYHSKQCLTFHSQPTFNVTQRGQKNGAFGIDEYTIKDEFGELKLNDIHHMDTVTGDLVYTYGYPLFIKDDSYTFDIEGYEKYVNRDGEEDVVDLVPLSGIEVTIDNALSDGKVIYTEDNPVGAEFGSMAELQSNQLRLDSLGKATYTWFAGFPNRFDSHTCDLNMTFDVNGRTYPWREQALKGIVLGEIPTGTNFVTAGPKCLLMVLRDPPGSQSFATWEKSTTTRTITVKKTEDSYADNKEIVKIAAGWTATNGVGMGTFIITKYEQILEGTLGFHCTIQKKSGTTSEIAVTATQAISTSNSPEYDGAEGDVFFGMGTNLLFGKCIDVGLYRNPDDPSKAIIKSQEATLTNVTFETTFAYTQHYIEHDLIPNLKKLRNTQLSIHPTIYVTSLSQTAPNYGESGTYTFVAPNDGKTHVDSVGYYNEQIRQWKEQLEINEAEKVTANAVRAEMENTGIMTNYSFDAGTSITNTYRNDTTIGTTGDFTQTYRAIGGLRTGFGIATNTGLTLETINEIGGDSDHSTSETHDEDSEKSTTTFSYTLKDTDPTDAISVDVYKNYSSFGSPIFHTRGGQTSNKYEGEVKTKYHEPGTTIMEATMQVEIPQIAAEPRTVSNVPSGSAANFALKLRNISAINADITYKLSLMESSNPNGAQLIIDGSPLTGDGRAVHIPYGEITKSLQLKQSDMSKLDYERIGIILSSQHQSSIADTVYVTAHFVPSSSPVTLAVNTNIINTHTDTVLVLTMKDFDRHFYNLKAFRMQYKQQGGQWTDLHEYVLDSTHLTTNQQALPNSASVVHRLSMKNSKAWTDGTYTFRIVSVSTYGTGEVYVYSNEETVIKDTSYPHPLGQAQPSDGVLDIGDEVSITYNIPFISGALTNENFLVTGVLNGAPVEHLTALRTYADDTQAAAHTEANINLSGKDYSLDAWLNIHSAGTLFRHGSGKQTMEVRTDEAGHLIVAFFGDSVVYTSDTIVPRNKWVFFTLSRKVTNNKGKINVAVAEGSNETIYLFTDKEVPLYNGNGPLSVGLGVEASVHEVLLWDEARDVETAVSQHKVTKSPSTRHLIGYWKMNEGEGKTIRDYARSRHMVMPAETWYLNNINKAVSQDGTQHLAIYTAGVAPSMDDDYAVELWMQGGAQADTAQVFQLGEVSMWFDKTGTLHLQNNDEDQIINHNFEILNNTWHHILLNVRRIGTAAVYLDGQRALTVSATAIGDFASDSLIIGTRRTYVPETDTTVAHYRYDRHWTGSVDEVRLWKTTIASDLLASKRKIRLTGQEPGLSLYYPFEKKQLDEYNQIVTVGTLEEQSINEKGEHNGTPATINGQMVNYVDDAPALKEKPTQTNVAFAFTASDTKIVIDVKEAPATIDGCTLNFTAKDVRSVNGNNSLPATWSAFIHRNELAWQDDDLYITKEVDDTFSISTVLINRSGKPQRWSLSELPTSLIASSTSGMLDPLEKATITFRINATAPLGKHERTIYAMGNNGIPTPLTLHITVTGDVPEWSVNPQDYESSMYMVAQLDFFGNISDDEDDIVAAFINDTCRGVAQPEYKERYDGYYLTMTIYGNAGDQNKEVTFHAYDASSGLVYTLVTPSQTVNYSPLSIVGRYDDPVLLSVNDKIEQRTTLKQGWNWISFYVETDNMKPQTVFRDIADDVVAVKGQQAAKMPGASGWVGSLDTLLNTRSYMVKMKNERELRIIGTSVDPATHAVLIHNEWGWPGYYGKRRTTLGTALAGADPQNGDIVRTQRAAAYFDDYEWVGSLQALEPGQGYAYYSVDPQQKWFAYPSSSVAAAPRRQMSNVQSPMSNEADADPTYTGRFAPDNEYGYPYNMILVGQVLLDNQPAANAEVGIFDGDECRSVGYTDAQGLLLMLVAGEDEAVLSYKMALGDQVYETVETLHYVTDAIVGTPDMPHLIRFGEGQGIEDVRSDDVRSTKVRKVFRNGVLYILRNGKTYTATGAEVK